MWSGYEGRGSKENLLKIFKDFDAVVLAILGEVDPESLKPWALLDMDRLPTWINRRLALMGDAAHPLLPRKKSNLSRPPLTSIRHRAEPLPSKMQYLYPSFCLAELCRMKFQKGSSYTKGSGMSELTLFSNLPDSRVET
jgi:hypothetical protein